MSTGVQRDNIPHLHQRFPLVSWADNVAKSVTIRKCPVICRWALKWADAWFDARTNGNLRGTYTQARAVGAAIFNTFRSCLPAMTFSGHETGDGAATDLCFAKHTPQPDRGSVASADALLFPLSSHHQFEKNSQ